MKDAMGEPHPWHLESPTLLCREYALPREEPLTLTLDASPAYIARPS